MDFKVFNINDVMANYSLEYSIDNGVTWRSYTIGSSIGANELITGSLYLGPNGYYENNYFISNDKPQPIVRARTFSTSGAGISSW